MIRLFEPLCGQRIPLGDHVILTTLRGLVLETARNEHDAAQKASWWRTRCGVNVKVVIIHLHPPTPTLAQRIRAAATPDEARRVLDAENWRYFSGVSGYEEP